MNKKQLEEMKEKNMIDGFDYQVIKNLLNQKDMINQQIKQKCFEYDRVYKEMKRQDDYDIIYKENKCQEV